MTREQAIAISLGTRSRVVDRLRRYQPQGLCDILEVESAEDAVDALIALGILKVDEPSAESPQEREQSPDAGAVSRSGDGS